MCDFENIIFNTVIISIADFPNLLQVQWKMQRERSEFPADTDMQPSYRKFTYQYDLRGTVLLISYFVAFDLAADCFRERLHEFNYTGIFIRCGM